MPPPRPLTSSSFADALGLPSAASNSAMTALYSAALGPVQLPRYLALFERFDRAGRAPIGWNSAASVLTLNWMALHFMWGAALVYLALSEGLGLVLFGVAGPLLKMPATIEYGLFAGLAVFSFALPGLFGDALLYTEIRKRIGRAIATAPTLPGACAVLERQASSLPRLKKIAIINVLLLTLIAIALFLLPPGTWGKASTSASTESAPTLSGKVAQANPGAAAAAADPAALPGLLRPAAPALGDPGADSAALPPAAEAPLNAPTPGATTAAEATPTSPALVAPLAPPAPLPTPAPALAPTPAPAPAAALTKAEKAALAKAEKAEKAALQAQEKAKKAQIAQEIAREKALAQASEKKPDSASTKSTKKAADQASAKLRKKTASSAAAAPAEKPATATAKPAAPATNADGNLPTVGTAAGHYLNVGTFAEVGNARRAQAKLLNAGLPAFRQTVTSPKGEMIRVRVGPFDNAAQAQKAAQQVRRMGLEAVAFRQRGK